MPRLYTEIDIDAPRSVVWQALIQKESWSQWNSFLEDQDGTQPVRQGQAIALALRRRPRESLTFFDPLVTLVQPETCLRWQMQIPGLRTEHVFELQDRGRQGTHYLHQEQISGWLTRFVFPFIRRDEQWGMDRMAQDLKRFVETEVVPRIED